MLFDGCDGRVARLTHTESAFGVQYDSLADLISFGAAPALLIYRWSLHYAASAPLYPDKLGWLTAFVYTTCTALRLARQHGMRGSTVEDIAAEAGISPRTFFNYFGTKEDAVLGLRAPAITDDLLASDRAHENDNLIVRITHLLLYIVRHSFNFANHAKFRERIDEFPEFRHRLKVHHINCEQVLIDYLNTVDWDAFNAAGRRGPLITRPENMPLTETAEERTRATVQLASAVLRQLHFAKDIADEDEVERRIHNTVKTFQALLKEN